MGCGGDDRGVRIKYLGYADGICMVGLLVNHSVVTRFGVSIWFWPMGSTHSYCQGTTTWLGVCGDLSWSGILKLRRAKLREDEGGTFPFVFAGSPKYGGGGKQKNPETFFRWILKRML
jgi:hypothetical protein